MQGLREVRLGLTESHPSLSSGEGLRSQDAVSDGKEKNKINSTKSGLPSVRELGRVQMT